MCNRSFPAFLLCLASLLLGCQAATESQISERPAETPSNEVGEIQSGAAELTLVSLKVPNMT